MKKVIGILMSFLFFTSFIMDTQATGLHAKLENQSGDIKKGEEVIVTLSLESISQDESLYAYQAKLDYNKALFEEVTLNDFQNQNNWSHLKYNQKTGEFVAIQKANHIKNKNVLSIHLKAKKTSHFGQSDIFVKDIIASNGKQDMSMKEAKASIHIVENQLIQTDQKEQAEMQLESDKEHMNEDHMMKYDAKEKLGKQTTPITQNHQNMTWLIIIIILMIALVGSWMIMKKRNHHNQFNSKSIKMKSLFLVVGLSISIMGTLYVAASTHWSKGELNYDGEVNYLDLDLLQYHLIHQKNIEKDRLSNADMNQDDKITITDLALLVQKIEKTLNYSVTFTNANQQSYFSNKNQDIIFHLLANVTDDEKIDSVIINGKEYQVKQDQDKQYQVNVGKQQKAGIHEYHISEVQLSNQKKVKTDFTIKIDILKSLPKIENYQVTEDIKQSKVNISYDVIDEDNSITSTLVEVMNENQEVIKTDQVKVGHNKITLSVEEGKHYQVQFRLNYDLDSNKLTTQHKEHTGVVTEVKDLEYVVDYQLDISDLTTYQNGKPSTVFEKSESIQLQFSSSNQTRFKPISITVNQQKYPVKKLNEYYVAIIKPIKQVGNQQLVIEALELSNGRIFEIKNQSVTVTILKDKPTVQNFQSKEDRKQKKLNLSFDLIDVDHTIKKAEVILYDDAQKEIDRKSIQVGKNQITLSTTSTSQYLLKVQASFYQLDQQLEESILLEETIKAIPTAQVKEAILKKEYLEKEEMATIIYHINTNQSEPISRIRINDMECVATQLENGTYQVQYPVGNKAGMQKLVAKSVIFQDGSKAEIHHQTKIDVLKDKPEIKKVIQTDKLYTSEVMLTFTVNDPEKSFMNGEAILIKESDGSIQKQPIQSKQNELAFKVIEGEIYHLDVYATFDRDSNQLENKPTKENQYTEKLVDSFGVTLLPDYQLTISDLKSYNKEQETKYFHKQEKVKIQFSSENISQFIPEKVIINKKEYTLTKQNDRYEAILDGYQTAGIKTIDVQKIILSNGKQLNVKDHNQIQIEVLKNKPSIEHFHYIEKENNQIELSFEIKDLDQTKIQGEVQVFDENKKLIKKNSIKVGKNKLSFSVTSSEQYQVKVLGDYDLDSNQFGVGDNEWKNQELLNESITTTARMIEMKDIQSIALYKKINGEIKEISSVSKAELAHLDQFLVKVDMKTLPSFYSKIQSYKMEDKTLKLALDYQQVVQYEGNHKQNKLEVMFGKVEDDVATQVNLDSLIELIKANPTGHYEVTTDIDASKFTTGQAIILQEFSGTIDFNGHVIRNLSRPLFTSLKGARIENLVIEQASMTANGAITPKMTQTTLKNVHITNSTIQAPNINGTGALVGDVYQNSVIENSSATNIKVGDKKRSGGLIGKIEYSTIRNVYVTGTVSSTWDGSGGLVGETPNGVTIENAYVNVKTNFKDKSSTNAGISGYSQNVILKNTLSLATSISGNDHGYRVYGSGLNNSSKNNYELNSSNLRSNASHQSISLVTKEKVKTKEFYRDELKWDESIWDFEHLSEGVGPTLKNADPNYQKNKGNTHSSLDIPGYDRIQQLEAFDAQKTVLYYNMSYLMPYYDAKYYVSDGNLLDKTHILNQKRIKQVLPFNKQDQFIVGLSKENKDQISKIKLVLEDDTTLEYLVNYKNSFDTIANYVIPELGVGYNYNKYLVDTNSLVYQKLLEKIHLLDYTTHIEKVTAETEARNYSEHYPYVKEKAADFLLKLFANNPELTVSFDNTLLNEKVWNELEKDRLLEKLLYTYNYFDRFYGFEIGGITISDIVYFDMNLFTKHLNSLQLSRILVDTVPQNERLTKSLPTFYNNRIKPFTGKSLGSFIEYFMQNLTEEQYRKEPAKWLVDHYWGTIYEGAADHLKETMRYHVWDHMKAREELILSILSYKGTDMYLLGMPTTIMVGNMKLYFNDQYPNVTQEQKVNRLKEFYEKAGNFYSTIGLIVNEKTRDVMSKKTHINFDSTHNRNWSNVADADPVYKGFNEVIDRWPVHGGASAFANGTDVYWMYTAFNFYATFTHESVHNQDGYLFLEGTGRRRGMGGEMFTNGFLTQGFGDVGVIPNYTYDYQITDNIGINLTRDRINSRDKIEDYYKKMFDVFTTLEYLEGQAFLELTPQEQSQLAYVAKEEVILPGPNRFLRVTNELKSKEEFEKMNLKTMSDLWDHKVITARDLGRRDMGSTTFNGSSMWYIPHYDDGATETTFKTIAYQLLAEYGYDGYVAYAGGKYHTDNQVIQALSKDPTMTWKKYQMNRYERVKNKLNEIQYFDSKQLIEEMKTAMRNDIKNGLSRSSASSQVTLRKNLYGYMKRATNDFRSSIYDQNTSVITINSAEDFMNKMKQVPSGHIVINQDLDFSKITVDTETLLNTKFTGTINGNHHKISGLTKPLYDTIIYSRIKDLKIENANIDAINTNKIGVLAKTIQSSTIENIHLNNIIIKGKEFIGGLAGNANEIVLKDTMLLNSNLTAQTDHIGGIFGEINRSTLQNVHVKDTTVKGRSRVGGLFGFSRNIHELKESSTNVNIYASGNAIGALAGEMNTGWIHDSYSLGKIHSSNKDSGGLVGWLTAANISNSFSNVEMNGKQPNGTGGLIGVVDQDHKNEITKIQNNIAFGPVQEGGYKFDGHTPKHKIESSFQNNYEYKDARGISTLTRKDIDFTNRISVADQSKITDPKFYTEQLHWDSKIWDFTNVASGGLPKLKNLDRNHVEQIVTKIKINSVDDFLNINTESNAIYELTSDLDFKSKTIPNNTVITKTFTGELDGKGFKIMNLTKPLFSQIKGANIHDLKLENTNITANEGRGALANESLYSNISNIYLNHITITNTANTVGSLFGKIDSSVLNQISIRKINISANSTIGGVVGEMVNSTLENTFVEGSLEGKQKGNGLGARVGGITGWQKAEETNRIEKAITKVTIKAENKTGNGGIIGGPNNGNVVISHALSLGTGETAHRIAGFSSVLSKVINVFEYALSSSVSNIVPNSTTISIVDEKQIKDKDFYIKQLQLDPKIWDFSHLIENGYPTLK